MDVDVEKLIGEGWTARIKVVGDHKYITLRKGRKERSLGPYTPELWKRVSHGVQKTEGSQLLDFEERIKKLEESQRKHESWTRDWIEALDQMRRELSESVRRRLRSDHRGCKHLDNEGVCTLWHWNLQTWEIPDWLRPMKRDKYQGRIVYRARVKKHPFICASCPSYEPRGEG